MIIDLESDGIKAVVESSGAELRSLQGRKEYMWQADPHYWNESAPWLFPIMCDLRQNQTKINGKTYVMQRHGFARNAEYIVTMRTAASVTLETAATIETLQQYPFHFVLRHRFSLTNGKMEIVTTVINNDRVRMPYCLGLHPGFRCPMDPDERFEDYEVIFDRWENVDCPTPDNSIRLIRPTDINYHFEGRRLKLQRSMFANDALVFPALRSRAVNFINHERLGIRIEFPGYRQLGLWTTTQEQASYLCIEPWNGTCDYVDESGVLTEKRGVLFLEPMTEAQHIVRLVLLEKTQ